MAQQNFPVSFSYQVVEKVPVTVMQDKVVTKTMEFTLSDSMIGVMEDAKAIATQLGVTAITTEIVALAILTRKTPRNVTTTGGKILRDVFNVDATRFAAQVTAKHNRSLYGLTRNFGGYAY